MSIITRYEPPPFLYTGGSLTRYHPQQVGGSGLTRYHSPQHGAGTAEELIKIAGPALLKTGQAFLAGVESGQSMKDSARASMRGIKRKLVGSSATYAKKRAKKAVRNKVRRVKDIFSSIF